MTKYLQEEIKETIAHQIGQDFPCSNQTVLNGIILRESSRKEAFEQSYPHFIPTGTKSIGYFDPYTDTYWKVVTLSDKMRGYRFYRAIVDSTIDDEPMLLMAWPCMTGYCCKVEFF